MSLHNSSYASSGYFERNLTTRAKRQLRIMHIFKKAASFMYDEVKNNKIKLLCFASFPTTTSCVMLTYVGLGLTPQSRKCRRKLLNSAKEPIQYRLYNDFLDASFEGKLDFNARQFFKHNVVQKKCKMMQSLYRMIEKRPDSVIKTITQNRLKRYVTKGELALVS